MGTTTAPIGPVVTPHLRGVSWPAIIAGAVATCATTLILLFVGSGTGLWAIAPFDGAGAATWKVAVAGMIWLVVTQWIASGLGGYLTGRLRSPWTNTRGDEVLFRDTAHGLLSWSLATLVTVALLGSAISGIAGTTAQTAATVAGSAGRAAASAIGPIAAYDLDRVLRPAQPSATSPAETAEAAQEIGRIVAHGLSAGEVPEADRAYLAELVAARTDVTQEQARSRVDELIATAKQAAARAEAAAKEASRVSAMVALLTALSMVIGAFVASVAAAYGGRLRDQP